MIKDFFFCFENRFLSFFRPRGTNCCTRGSFLCLSVSLSPSPSPPCPTFGCTPANSNTHGMLGIVQQMPLGRTFLSGTTSLFTLFIQEYLSPAPTCQHFSSPASDKFSFLCKSPPLLDCICGTLLHFKCSLGHVKTSIGPRKLLPVNKLNALPPAPEPLSHFIHPTVTE